MLRSSDLSGYHRGMISQGYPEHFLAPMRDELTRIGFEELRTPEAVDEAVKRAGTTMVVVNSVCGCAAGKARPGIALALRNGVRPDHLATVFAGGDIEATARAREYFAPYPPSSPSVAILKDGKLVYMMERRDIEISGSMAIADRLQAAFREFCE
jgi:putative YphP/YqiW family bacilliredoxin